MMNICTILDRQVGNVHFGTRVFCRSKIPFDAAGIFMTRFHPPTSEQKKSNGTRPWQITRFGKEMFNNRRISPTGEKGTYPWHNQPAVYALAIILAILSYWYF